MTYDYREAGVLAGRYYYDRGNPSPTMVGGTLALS